MSRIKNLFRAFRIYNYRLWAVGAVVSNIGAWVQSTAQDWLVLTRLTDHNATAVGIVIGLQFAPQLLLLPWSGSAADRFNQRKLLIATQTTMGVLALALSALTLTNLVQLWHVYVFALLFGCAAAIDAPVRQTFVSELVGDDDLQNAVALNSASYNAARVIGPALSGLVMAMTGIGVAFLLNSLSFVAVVASLFCLRLNELRPSERAQGQHGGFLEGLRYVRKRPDLMTILAMLFFIGTFGLNFPVFIGTVAVRLFHADAAGYGLLSSALALGTLLAALYGAAQHKPRLDVMLLGAGVFGVGCILAGLAPGYTVFAAALAVMGWASLTFTNATNGWMQLSTERAMRGRVMALRVGIALGGAPIGAPIEGFVADAFGPRQALAIGAAAGFIALLTGMFARLRGFDRCPEIAENK